MCCGMSVQHVVPLREGWGVQEEHEPQIREFFSSEDEAVHHAYHAAGAGGSVIVHDLGGEKHEYVVV